ncbi:hypothetical protein RRG08_051304 [Elysia crispata]|uniref:Uncharacterized protein n=1 Tax=Elysia crispata TaxID=231223 RepID=A0AAE1CL29_9GAST|nr:hypothetical protein RRG08_051304 [Elysia crispata]
MDIADRETVVSTGRRIHKQNTSSMDIADRETVVSTGRRIHKQNTSSMDIADRETVVNTGRAMQLSCGIIHKQNTSSMDIADRETVVSTGRRIHKQNTSSMDIAKRETVVNTGRAMQLSCGIIHKQNASSALGLESQAAKPLIGQDASRHVGLCNVAFKSMPAGLHPPRQQLPMCMSVIYHQLMGMTVSAATTRSHDVKLGRLDP